MNSNEILLEWSKEGRKRALEILEKEYLEKKNFKSLQKLGELKED